MCCEHAVPHFSCFFLCVSKSATVRELGDLSELWYREYFLEVAREIQFPIDTSLPWLLAKTVLSKRHAGGMEAIMYVFSIYNDAGSRALHLLKRRHLFEELDAEVLFCTVLFSCTGC